MQTATTATPNMVPAMTISKQTLQASNIARVRALVAEFQAGRPEGYLAGVHDDIKGSVLGGLIPGGSDFTSKAQFAELMTKMPEYMEVRKFEPKNWRAVNDDVLFQVDWAFTWKPTGQAIEATALVRKVVRDGMICEKYHCLCEQYQEAITGEKNPHDQSTVARVQELLAEYGAGRPEGYLAGVADDFKGNVLEGLVPGAVFTSKQEFMAMMPQMEEVMEVTKFEPHSFVALPNNDMMFLCSWTFTWKATGQAVDATGVVRKVLNKDNNLCEKYHMLDCDAIFKDSPRDVLASKEEWNP